MGSIDFGTWFYGMFSTKNRRRLYDNGPTSTTARSPIASPAAEDQDDECEIDSTIVHKSVTVGLSLRARIGHYCAAAVINDVTELLSPFASNPPRSPW